MTFGGWIFRIFNQLQASKFYFMPTAKNVTFEGSLFEMLSWPKRRKMFQVAVWFEGHATVVRTLDECSLSLVC